MKSHYRVKTGSREELQSWNESCSKALWDPPGCLSSRLPPTFPIPSTWAPVLPMPTGLLRTLWSLLPPAKLETCFKVNILSMKEMTKLYSEMIHLTQTQPCLINWTVQMLSVMYNPILNVTIYIQLQTQLPLLSSLQAYSTFSSVFDTQNILPFHWDQSLTHLFGFARAFFYSLNVLSSTTFLYLAKSFFKLKFNASCS